MPWASPAKKAQSPCDRHIFSPSSDDTGGSHKAACRYIRSWYSTGQTHCFCFTLANAESEEKRQAVARPLAGGESSMINALTTSTYLLVQYVQ